MIYFLVNLLLALLWAVLQAFRPVDVFGGLVLGYAAIFLSRNWLGPDAIRYVYRVPRLILFGFYYLGELISSALTVMRALFRDQTTLRPGIIAFPLDARTDFEIVLLNCLISMPPGTLGVAVSPDRRTLYIHVIDVPDIEATQQSIKNGLERRLLEVLR